MNFQAHKEYLTTLQIITLAEKQLLTSSIDNYIRLWDLNGSLKASVNVNHPLPIQWDLALDHLKKVKKNVIFALTIVKFIERRYKKTILLAEKKMI